MPSSWRELPLSAISRLLVLNVFVLAVWHNIAEEFMMRYLPNIGGVSSKMFSLIVQNTTGV